MIDLKQHVSDGGKLVSAYINGDKNLNVYNGFEAPTAEQLATLQENATKVFGKASVEVVEYTTVKTIQSELTRQTALKDKIAKEAQAEVAVAEGVLVTNSKK